MMSENPVFIIAEAGVNHNGDPDMAFQLVDVAVEAGADAIKFQTFKAELIVTQKAQKATYQKQTTQHSETQLEMLKGLELKHETHYKLEKYCKQKGIEFLSTAFDFESLEFLRNNFSLNILKIPSGEITNGPFLLAHSVAGCDLILSTGMSTLAEIEVALGVLAFGLTKRTEPSKENFQLAYKSQDGQKALREKVTLLHCLTEYPAPVDEVNLRAMDTMREAFGLKVGYSDHSEGIVIPAAAVAMGACVIEKHFTLDKKLQGPDHQASLDPNELIAMVKAIRAVELAKGDGIKKTAPSEFKNKDIARKSLVAATDIMKGSVLSEKNIAIKRPGVGRSPMDYWDVIGMKTKKNISRDEII